MTTTTISHDSGVLYEVQRLHEGHNQWYRIPAGIYESFLKAKERLKEERLRAKTEKFRLIREFTTVTIEVVQDE